VGEGQAADRRVYLDHNATSPLRAEVRAEWLAVQAELPGNPSSLHAAGRRARQRIDLARERTAAALGVNEEELVFTSGGTEANNLALAGCLRARRAGGPPAGLVTTSVEHASVLEPARALERAGHPLSLAPVDSEGLPEPEALWSLATSSGVGLVSVQAASNETGSLPDLALLGGRLAELPADRRPIFHTDAVQALGRIPLDLDGWGVDLASFSAHKVGGPPGVGVLFRRRGTPVEPAMRGGGQEAGHRGGTENAAGIAALAIAVELAVAEQEALERRLRGLSAGLWGALSALGGGLELVGPPIDSGQRLPNTLAVLASGREGRVLVTRLDLEGLEVGAGSACASGSLEPSHVLLAMGLNEERARSGLRLSLGRTTTREECERAVEIIQNVIAPSLPTRDGAEGL